jgi:N-acetylneuraminic acid mutarotase
MAGPAYQLLAVTPAIATAGDALTLEGTFAATAMVQFPGGAMQAATVLGEHRATVIVPEAATAGDLTVSTGGVTLGRLSFRRTSFALGIQPSRISYEQTDGARQSSTLRIARSSATTAVIKHWLYVVGGADGAGALNSVERAGINADGTIESFDVVDGATLVEARAGHTSVVIGDSLYVIGGSGTSGASASIERARINDDGSLGSFTLVPGVALTTARSGHTSALIGNAVYVIGGTRSDGTKLGSIERAIIESDGSLGTFTSVDAILALPRSGHTTELVGNALYVIGGDPGGGSPSGSVERATVGGDGTLGAFMPAGTALVSPRSGHRSVILGSAMYVFGGSTSGGVTREIERAPINASGSLGGFAVAPGTALSIPRTSQSTATVGNMLYTIGGRGTGSAVQSTERASLNADSAIDSFVTSQVALVLPRGHHTTTVIRDAIYVIGRSGDANTVERGTLLPDGTIAGFATAGGVALDTNRSSHTTAVLRHGLYVIGGSGTDALATVERADISLDGSLGPFAQTSVSLKEARFGHVSVALGSFVYVIGGIGASHARLASIERATINDDGTLSSFTTVSGVALNTGRNYFTAVVTDSYLYVIGGLDDMILGTSIERATIGSDGSLGPFTPVANLQFGRGAHASPVIGNAVYVIGGLLAGAHVPAVERATIGRDGSLSTFGEVSANHLSETRARHTAVAIGDDVFLVGGETMLPSGQAELALDLERASLR